MEGCTRQLQVLKDILNVFTQGTSLQVNYSKSMMVPISQPLDKLELLATSFNCAKGSLPFTYLGLPLETTKPKVEDFLPLITKCERRLQATLFFLSKAAKLQMTNVVFTSLPMYQMGTFLLPKIVIEQIDKYRKHYLWRGSNIKEEGGLGVINLKTQNEALLLKKLHKFFNKVDTPSVQPVWEKKLSKWQTPQSHQKRSFCGQTISNF